MIFSNLCKKFYNTRKVINLHDKMVYILLFQFRTIIALNYKDITIIAFYTLKEYVYKCSGTHYNHIRDKRALSRDHQYTTIRPILRHLAIAAIAIPGRERLPPAVSSSPMGFINSTRVHDESAWLPGYFTLSV